MVLKHFKVGDRLCFRNDKSNALVVRAKSENYLIATTESDRSEYTIIDTDKGICGPNDRVFNPYDYTKQEDVERCLSDLLKGKVAISRRYRSDINRVLQIL